MLDVTVHDDVQRLSFSTWRSRRAGYSVSVFAVRGVLIDSAFDDVGPELMAWIATNPVDGAIITHAHDDHAGNAERLARAGVPLHVAADTEALMRTPEPRGLYRRWTWGDKPLLRSVAKPFDHPALNVMPARGHSHDHHVVWDPDRETLFAADLFLSVKVRVAHPIDREDVRMQVDALRAALTLRPARVFDAHRGLLADGCGLLRAKTQWMEDTIGRIDRRIDQGWNDRAIMRDVLGGEQLLGYVSFNDYSRRNFVANVRQTHARLNARAAR